MCLRCDRQNQQEYWTRDAAEMTDSYPKKKFHCLGVSIDEHLEGVSPALLHLILILLAVSQVELH